MNWQYLVSLDIGGIHEYIFGTNKLREIRGASVLLDRLNRIDAIQELSKYGQKDIDWKCIVAGGGNIKVLFTDKGKAETYKKSLEKLFRDNTGTIFTVILSENLCSNEKEWIDHAERKLQTKKLMRREKGQVLTSGFLKACQACGLYPAEKEDPLEGTRYICKSCYQKVTESINYNKTEIYNRLKNKIGFEPEFPSEFSEIGKGSEPEGYMGFIYADGNRMGEHFSTISSFDGLESFSKDIEDATFEATATAIVNHFSREFPLQVILAGGDDLILALPAHKVMDVAIDFCEKFNNKLKTYSVTTSASVIICHDSLPIRNILSAAEFLLKNAKAESRKNGGGSYIDFTVVTGSALEDPISRRKRELEYLDIGSYSITKRPYSLEEMKKLVIAIKELKKVDFPNNKLKALYTYLFKGHYQSILDALYLKTKLEDAHKDTMDKLIKEFNLTKIFPWEEIDTNRYTTPFGDIVELYEFIH